MIIFYSIANSNLSQVRIRYEVGSDNMVNFIICDDDLDMRDSIINIVSKFMMTKEIEYKTYLYNDYDDEFLKIVNKKLPFKIYILDIETPTRTGIDVARIIRHKDEDSAIIFLTGHEELGPRLLSKDITFLAFINKFDDYKNRLQKNIGKAMIALEKKKCLRFEDGGTYYAISYHDVLYITKDSLSRNTIVVTEFGDFKVHKPLSFFLELLDESFVQTHRACLINKERVISVNKKEHLAIFDNGSKIDLISTRFRIEELMSEV